MPDARLIALIARQELRIALRNRWVILYAAVFAVLTFSISYFGLSVAEFAGFQEFDRTAVSLLNLVLYLVPFATMLMAVQSFSAEGGGVDRLLTEPVARLEILLGKISGVGVAHILAAVIGFGFTGMLIAAKAGMHGFGAYLSLAGFTIILGIVFIALASFLAIAAGRGARAYALVLVAWFVSILMFDLVIIGISFVLPEGWANRVALAGVFLNPADAARVAALLSAAGKEMLGAAGAILLRAFGGAGGAIALLTLALAGWTAVYTALAADLLKRQDY